MLQNVLILAVFGWKINVYLAVHVILIKRNVKIKVALGREIAAGLVWNSARKNVIRKIVASGREIHVDLVHLVKRWKINHTLNFSMMLKNIGWNYGKVKNIDLLYAILSYIH